MSNKIKKPSWLEDFKAFAVKGNAMALAVPASKVPAFKAGKALKDAIK